MTALKRSLVYLKRKHKRSVLLFLLLFVISCSISIGLSVWNNIGDAIKDVEQRMGTSFVMKLPADTNSYDSIYVTNYETNYDFIAGTSYIGPPLDESVIEAVIEVDGISAYNADETTWVHLDDAVLLPGIWTGWLKAEEYDPEWRPVEIMYSRVTKIHGNSNTALSEQFRTGSFTLVEGRHITPKDLHKTLISEELAELNGLKIGDTITFSSRLRMMGEAPDTMALTFEPMNVEIVGIFRVNGFQPMGEWVNEADITYNWLLTDAETVKEYSVKSDDAVFVNNPRRFKYHNLTFFVDDPTKLESIIEQVNDLDTITKDFYDISIDDTMYKSTTDALRNIRNIVMALVAVIVAGCAIVLLIVFTMWVRSRRQEISIYLSMGLNRFSILGQFVLEAAIIAVLAGTLAFGVCQEVPNMIGNYMLADAIEDAQPNWEEPTREEIHQAAMAGTTHELFQYTNSEYAGPEQIDFAFHFTDFLVLILFELLLITAAILKGGWFIFSMQPRKIMTDLR